jgi:perosamine synthetase
MMSFVARSEGMADQTCEIVARIRSVLPAGLDRVALHEPRFGGREREYLNNCIDTGWVSYAGPYVHQFEAALAQACEVPHAIAVSSGTVALQIALTTAGVGTSDEVLIPSLTFVATANAVVHAGAVPHFVDVDEKTLGIDPAALSAHLASTAERRDGATYNKATGRRIAALMPVHIFGHPCDMDALDAIAVEFGLTVIEDATEALGSRYKGKPCGSLAPLSALSFNGNKLVTTGGGGAVLVNDNGVADRIRHLTTTAKLPHRWAFNHDEVGWNFRLPNINAAVGLGQLEQLPGALAAKERLWRRYIDAFVGFSAARVFQDAGFAESNHWLVALILERGSEPLLESVLAATHEAGIMTRPAWTPMHLLPMYRDNPRSGLAATESLARRIVSLPSSPFLAPA